MQDFIEMNIDKFNNTIQEQIFLQENGVSFSYTDSLSYYDRQALIINYNEFLRMKNEKNQEIINNSKNKG